MLRLMMFGVITTYALACPFMRRDVPGRRLQATTATTYTRLTQATINSVYSDFIALVEANGQPKSVGTAQ